MTSGPEPTKLNFVDGTQPTEDLRKKLFVNRKPLKDQDLLDILEEVGKTRLGDPDIEIQMTIHTLALHLLVSRQEERDLRRTIADLRNELKAIR
jgi:hypothetical protein